MRKTIKKIAVCIFALLASIRISTHETVALYNEYQTNYMKCEIILVEEEFKGNSILKVPVSNEKNVNNNSLTRPVNVSDDMRIILYAALLISALLSLVIWAIQRKSDHK